jgi:hypothetical protein
MDPGKTVDVDNVSYKNRKCGKLILKKQDMCVMYPRKQDVDNGS